jgi:AraC family transcriptional regulator of adaptative response/methylated-DNA-[protein]-cysteine methyltransferase
MNKEKDRIVNYYRIEKAIGFLTENFHLQPDLDEIARKVHLSPFHFQRIFLDWVGLTPKKFLQYLTLDYLKGKIFETQNMMEAAESAGLSSQSRVHDLFVNIEGVSPHQFKTAGKGLEIFYGYHASPFGMCFLAVAEKGICALHFIDEERRRNEYELFANQWSFASLIHKPDYTQTFVQKIFNPRQPNPDSLNPSNPDNLNLLVQGTPFQVKVWEALLHIPFGAVRSFQQVAQAMGQPGSIRSVASAVGRNPILYLIPCHRVISKDGTMGNYHWGRVRKQTMIGWEMASIEV